MDKCVSYFISGQHEGILITLEALSDKDGYEDLTKEYVINKLTELQMTYYIEPIIAEFYTEKSK